MKYTRIILLIALLGAAAIGLPSLRSATITVTEVGDGFDVHTNLRQALADANDGDTIEFDPLLGGWNLPVAPVLGQTDYANVVPLGALRRAVAGPIVDHDDLEAPRQPDHRCADAIDRGSDPVALVVRGNDHRDVDVGDLVRDGSVDRARGSGARRDSHGRLWRLLVQAAFPLPMALSRSRNAFGSVMRQ